MALNVNKQFTKVQDSEFRFITKTQHEANVTSKQIEKLGLENLPEEFYTNEELVETAINSISSASSGGIPTSISSAQIKELKEKEKNQNKEFYFDKLNESKSFSNSELKKELDFENLKGVITAGLEKSPSLNTIKQKIEDVKKTSEQIILPLKLEFNQSVTIALNTESNELQYFSFQGKQIKDETSKIVGSSMTPFQLIQTLNEDKTIENISNITSKKITSNLTIIKLIKNLLNALENIVNRKAKTLHSFLNNINELNNKTLTKNRVEKLRNQENTPDEQLKIDFNRANYTIDGEKCEKPDEFIAELKKLDSNTDLINLTNQHAIGEEFEKAFKKNGEYIMSWSYNLKGIKEKESHDFTLNINTSTNKIEMTKEYKLIENINQNPENTAERARIQNSIIVDVSKGTTISTWRVLNK